MSKDPAFLFYYKDFENDTADWEADAVGWYIRLLCFQAGNGYIPSEIEELAQLARVKFSEYKIFCERWATRLACKFKPLSDTQLYNPKLSKVQAERKSSAIKKSVLAVLGNFIKTCNLTDVEKKKLKDLFHKEKSFYNILNSEKRKEIIEEFLVGKSFLIIEQRYAKRNAIEERTQQEDEIEIENEDIIKTEVYPTFDDFWDLYDKKIGKKSKIEKKWDLLSQSTKEEIMQYVPKYIQSQPDKQYRKNPETFLNNESWNDEIILKKNGTDQPTINRQTAETYHQNGTGWD